MTIGRTFSCNRERKTKFCFGIGGASDGSTDQDSWVPRSCFLGRHNRRVLQRRLLAWSDVVRTEEETRGCWNGHYSVSKIERSRQRDGTVASALRRIRWPVIQAWEDEARRTRNALLREY